MQELRILKWCDVCFKESGAYVEADQGFIVSVKEVGKQGAGLLRRLELCEQHAKSVAELRATLRDCGTTPDAEPPRQTGTRIALPAPPEEVTPPPRKAPPAWEKKRMPCPICEEDMQRGSVCEHLCLVHGAQRPKQPAKCPDCGEKWTGLNSMATHRRRTHGWDIVAEMAGQVKGRKKS
jgi:hypothetical protein